MAVCNPTGSLTVTINESIELDSENQYYINQKKKFLESIN